MQIHRWKSVKIHFKENLTIIIIQNCIIYEQKYVTRYVANRHSKKKKIGENELFNIKNKIRFSIFNFKT